MIARKAHAVWEGTLKEGKGSMQTGTKSFSGPYSFASRFESGSGTNPEELIAAAHAGCFSMAFSAQLEAAGYKATRVETTATVSMVQADGGFKIDTVTLDMTGQVPGIGDADFHKIADAAKAGCPVSKALAGVQIKLNAKLVR